MQHILLTGLVLMLAMASGNVAVAQGQSATMSPPNLTELRTTATSHPWLAWAPLNNGYMEQEFQFSGMAGLKKVLLSERDQFVNTVTAKLLMYALGRNLQYYDQPAVRAIVRDSAQTNFTFASLIAGVVQTPQFQFRQQ